MTADTTDGVDRIIERLRWEYGDRQLERWAIDFLAKNGEKTRPDLRVVDDDDSDDDTGDRA